MMAHFLGLIAMCVRIRSARASSWTPFSSGDASEDAEVSQVKGDHKAKQEPIRLLT